MRCVVYPYAVSLGVVTFYRTSRVYAVSNTKSAIFRGIPYSLLSLLVGWWCFPWGFIKFAGNTPTIADGDISSRRRVPRIEKVGDERRLKEEVRHLIF